MRVIKGEKENLPRFFQVYSNALEIKAFLLSDQWAMEVKEPFLKVLYRTASPKAKSLYRVFRQVLNRDTRITFKEEKIYYWENFLLLREKLFTVKEKLFTVEGKLFTGKRKLFTCEGKHFTAMGKLQGYFFLFIYFPFGKPQVWHSLRLWPVKQNFINLW